MSGLSVVQLYYALKPIVPRSIQITFRRKYIFVKKLFYRRVWPIDERAVQQPVNWQGWPMNKKFALVLTHDVESKKGHEKCHDLIKLEKSLGFRSSFYFVPERYKVSNELLNHLKKNGFEVGVHGLNHDGKLYKSRELFQKRADSINQYLNAWDAVGFRSPSMQCNLDWIHQLNIKYDASTYDTAVFEFKSNGSKTIFPFLVQKKSSQNGYIELPYTLPQDFYLFVIMKERSIDIWKKKLDWIADNGGMALVITHPDYMNFGVNNKKMDEYPSAYYYHFLQYIRDKYKNQYWHVLPKEMALFWSKSFRH